jgi:hypothetical protein
LRLDDRLLREAKRLAADTGKGLAEVVEELLREALLRRRAASARPGRVRLPTFGGRGVLPGVDLDDSAGLLERMDGDRGPA